MRPGPNQTNTTATPPTTAPVSTGTWFAVGITSQGPLTPQLLTSFAQFQKVYGPRGTYAAAVSDAVEQYFGEGGSRLYFCRAFGPTGKAAKVELLHAATKVLKVEANGPGIWANTFKIVVAVVESTKFTLTVENAAGEVLEVSPVLSTTADAAAWSKNSAYIVCTALTAENPDAATAELTGGTDETTVNTAGYEEVLKKFGPELGPGQLSVPSVTTTAILEGVFKIAKEQKRKAVVSLARGITKAEMVTAAAAIRALGLAARHGYIQADWQEEAPVTGTVAPRFVCPTAYVAASIAKNDALGNPNQAPAGKWGILGSLGKSTAFTEAEVEELYTAGVNLCKIVAGQVRLYGNRTPVNPQSDPLYLQFSNVRTDMAIEWKALAIEENFMFSELDGQGLDTAAYGNALKGMLLELYKVGALFGETPEQAFRVDTGADVNTIASEAEGNCNATIAARRSPTADQVNLNIVRVAITQEV